MLLLEIAWLAGVRIAVVAKRKAVGYGSMLILLICPLPVCCLEHIYLFAVHYEVGVVIPEVLVLLWGLSHEGGFYDGV